MNKSLANFISILFHPLFIPLYVLLVLLFSNAYFAVILNRSFKIFLFLFTLTAGVVLPLLSATLFKKFGIISSLRMPDRKERVLPFLMTSIYYIIAFSSLQKIEYLPSTYSKLFLATSLILLCVALITYFWKISIHLMSLGSMVGLLLALNLDNPFFLLPFITTILIAGITASSRLSLKVHTPAQLYLGFLFGFVFMFFTFL